MKTGFFALTIFKAAWSIFFWFKLKFLFSNIAIEELFFENKSFKYLFTYQYLILLKKPFFDNLFENSFLISSSGYNKSIGSSIKIGPGTPDFASLSAFWTTGTISRTFLTETAFLTYFLNNESWSISCREPFPFNKVAAAPPKRTSGDCAICAFLTAVTVFVTPGPAVTTATPTESVILETASAANTVVASSLTWIISISSFSQPTKIGDMCPPQRVKILFTPFLFKQEAMANPAWFCSDISSYYLKLYHY